MSMYGRKDSFAGLKKWLAHFDGVRAKLGGNAPAIAVGSVILLVVLALVIRAELKPEVIPGPPPASPVYYYDVANGAIHSGSGDDFAPIAGSGGESVRAYLFACGKCTDANKQVAYVEKFSPEARQYLLDNMKDPEARVARIMAHVDSLPNGHMISLPAKELHWVSISDELAASIMVKPDCPGGTPATECRP